MIKLTSAEKRNLEWLESVVAECSGYSNHFKYFAQKNIEKFEHKINGTISPKSI